uniref:Uncharacterized protein n=1 Tax=Stomoxys calcitrans TaxID=35570 RepID=A0A1I8P5X0_STOCA
MDSNQRSVEANETKIKIFIMYGNFCQLMPVIVFWQSRSKKTCKQKIKPPQKMKKIRCPRAIPTQHSALKTCQRASHILHKCISLCPARRKRSLHEAFYQQSEVMVPQHQAIKESVNSTKKTRTEETSLRFTVCVY